MSWGALNCPQTMLSTRLEFFDIMTLDAPSGNTNSSAEVWMFRLTHVLYARLVLVSLTVEHGCSLNVNTNTHDLNTTVLQNS